MVQFRLPGRLRDNLYGDSILWPFRWIYKMLIRTEDAVMNFRWQRSPDRLLWKIDVTGVPWPEHFSYVQMWRQWLHKVQAQGNNAATGGDLSYLSGGGGRSLESQWKMWAPHQDLFMPVTQNHQNSVEPLAAGSDPGRIFDLQFLRENGANSLGAPKYAVNLDNDPDPSKTLSRKDAAAAFVVKRIQRALLAGFHRIIQINLSLKGIDPHNPTSYFRVHGTPVTFLDEQQRAELYDLRIDQVDRLMNLARNLGVAQAHYRTWAEFVLREFGRFDQSFVKFIVSGIQDDLAAAAQAAAATGQTEPPLSNEDIEDRLAAVRGNLLNELVSSTDPGVLLSVS